MARVCEVCGAPVGDDDLFCINCGSRLAPVKHATAPQTGEPPKAVSAPTLPQVEGAGSLSGLYASDVVTQGDWGDGDAATMVFDQDEDDPDAPTFVFEPEPVYVLVRLRTGEELELKSPAMVGKGTKATNRVNGNRGISREHLRFRVDDGGRCLIEDNASTNGTYINDTRLEPNVPVEIADGSVIRLADEDFEFHVR